MESEKVKEIKELLIRKAKEYESQTHLDILTLINELEKCSEKWQKLCADEVALNTPLKERIKELESENKELKRYKLDWLNSEKMHLQADMEDTEFELFCANKSLDKVREENQALKDRIAELEKENAELNERLTVFDPISAFADNYVKGVKEAEEIVLNMFMNLVDRYRDKLDEQKHFYETASISHRDISLTALNTAYRCLDETLKEFINEKPTE